MDISEIAGRVVERGASLTRLLDLSDTPAGGLPAQPDLPGAEGGGESDGSFPLADPRWEALCCAVASGTVEWRAYMDHVSSRCSRQTASQQASRGVRRGEVRSRVSWLIRTRNQQRAAALVSGGESVDPSRPMSREAKLREIEGLLRDSSLSPSDRLRAIEQHNRMMAGETDGKKASITDIDPADLVEYLRKAAEQGKDIATMGQTEVGTGMDPADRFGADTPKEAQPVGGGA